MARPYVLEELEYLKQHGGGTSGDAITIIPEGTDISVNDRQAGKLYFKTTSVQATGIAQSVRVSPVMGIKLL